MNIAQFEAKQAAERAAFEKQLAVNERVANAGLPALPEYVGGLLYGAQLITYRNDRQAPRTLRQAIELFKAFTVVPAQVLRDGSTMVHPQNELPEKVKRYKQDGCRNMGDYVAEIRVSHISDSPAPTTAKLHFFARASGILFNVEIEFGTGYIGSCPQLRPVVREERARNGRIVSRTFQRNAVLNGAADSYLSYGSGDFGPIKTSADHRYLFVSDMGDADALGADCTHAVAMLESVADFLGE